MGKNSKSLVENTALPAHWFQSGLLPQLPSVQTMVFTQPSRIQYQDGVKFFLVTKGQGTLRVNGENHAISPDSCGLLYNYEFHQFIPARGSVLEVVHFTCTYETFVFAAMLPGNRLEKLQLATETILLTVQDEKELHRLRVILNDLKNSKAIEADAQRQYLMLFELLTRLGVAWEHAEEEKCAVMD